MKTNQLIHGDFLVESDRIESGSVDLILTDPPYGTVKDLDIDDWDEDTTDWDEAIAPAQVFEVAERLLRRNGKLVLFGQEPYTSELITSAPSNLPFSYRMVWRKDTFANALGCKTAPVNEFEDVLVFSKEHDTTEKHPLRQYFGRLHDYIGLTKAGIIDRIGQRADHCFRYDSTQFALCTAETYAVLIDQFAIEEMDGFEPYADLERSDRRFKEQHPNVFNLSKGEKYKSNVLEYGKDYDGYHPTQKPVALLEDLIKTFSNAGDLVVDLTAGSGSTAVAAKHTGREYIAIEKDRNYYEVAVGRVEGPGSPTRPTTGQQDLAAFSD